MGVKGLVCHNQKHTHQERYTWTFVQMLYVSYLFNCISVYCPVFLLHPMIISFQWLFSTV